MASRKYVFKFPAEFVDRPLATELVRDHGLVVNILRARVEPDEEGMLVIDLIGDAEKIDAGLAYARGFGVEVEPLSKDVTWSEERCTDCTACRNVCPNGALSTAEGSLKVSFDKEKCIACGLCVPACPYAAVEIAL